MVKVGNSPNGREENTHHYCLVGYFEGHVVHTYYGILMLLSRKTSSRLLIKSYHRTNYQQHILS